MSAGLTPRQQAVYDDMVRAYKRNGKIDTLAMMSRRFNCSRENIWFCIQRIKSKGWAKSGEKGTRQNTVPVLEE